MSGDLFTRLEILRPMLLTVSYSMTFFFKSQDAFYLKIFQKAALKLDKNVLGEDYCFENSQASYKALIWDKVVMLKT